MKRYIILLLVAASALSAVVSCRKDELNPESIITVPSVRKNAFDQWLDANYVNPYNIVVKYRYVMDEADYSYYTIPANMESSIIMAHLVKYLCIDSYDEVAGAAFTRRYFPKAFFYIGEWEYKNNGVFTLGTAEGGKKIYLAGVNYIPQVLAGKYMGYTDPAEAVNHFYVKTIHHEFTHILNQTKDFPADFKQVTPTSYDNDAWSSDEYKAGYLERGFISSYAQNSDREDFAEMNSIYITHSPEWWEAEIAKAGNGGSYITTKLDIVKSYMKTTFNIDLDELRAAVLRRQQEVMSGEVDLTSLDIK